MQLNIYVLSNNAINQTHEIQFELNLLSSNIQSHSCDSNGRQHSQVQISNHDWPNSPNNESSTHSFDKKQLPAFPCLQWVAESQHFKRHKTSNLINNLIKGKPWNYDLKRRQSAEYNFSLLIGRLGFRRQTGNEFCRSPYPPLPSCHTRAPYQGTSKPTSLLACRKIHLTPFSSKNVHSKFLSEFLTIRPAFMMQLSLSKIKGHKRHCFRTRFKPSIIIYFNIILGRSNQPGKEIVLGFRCCFFLLNRTDGTLDYKWSWLGNCHIVQFPTH